MVGGSLDALRLPRHEQPGLQCRRRRQPRLDAAHRPLPDRRQRERSAPGRVSRTSGAFSRSTTPPSRTTSRDCPTTSRSAAGGGVATSGDAGSAGRHAGRPDRPWSRTSAKAPRISGTETTPRPSSPTRSSESRPTGRTATARSCPTASTSTKRGPAGSAIRPTGPETPGSRSDSPTTAVRHRPVRCCPGVRPSTAETRRAASSTQGAPRSVDQRGSPRPTDGDANGSFVCDIGAFEAFGAPEPGPLGASIAGGVALAWLARRSRRPPWSRAQLRTQGRYCFAMRRSATR